MKRQRAVEAANKDKVSKLIAEAEKYLSENYNSKYYDKVVASCEAEKAAENEAYEKVRATIKTEHEQTLAKLSAADEIKDEKYVYKNRLFDAQMSHESRLQEIKDRKHDAFAHKFHLIDLLTDVQIHIWSEAGSEDSKTINIHLIHPSSFIRTVCIS